MSIHPVPAIAATDPRSAPTHDAAARARVAKARPDPAPSDSGNPPIRESSLPPANTKSFELPRDAVQVQRESQNQIVIKYLDGSGKVIFQVPSAQILALQHAIEQALEQQAQSRKTAAARPPAADGGIRHAR